MPKREGWVNVYPHSLVFHGSVGQGVALGSDIYASRENAQAMTQNANVKPLDTVKIEWFEPAPKKETYDVVGAGAGGYRWAGDYASIEAARRGLAEAQERGAFKPYRIVKTTEEVVG